MAIFHWTMQPICRSVGGSATNAAAYQSGAKIVDQRTGISYNHKAKRGVVLSKLVLPNWYHGTPTQSDFWNEVELHHTRKRAVVARSIECSLPVELPHNARIELTIAYAEYLASQYSVGVDVAIHLPSEHGDQRNHHAHLLLTACSINQNGTLGKKVIRLDPISCGRSRLPDGRLGLPNFAVLNRRLYAKWVNNRLRRYGHDCFVDHRSLIDQGIDREPGRHLGLIATNMMRRGKPSLQIERTNSIIMERNICHFHDAEEIEETDDLYESEAGERSI